MAPIRTSPLHLAALLGAGLGITIVAVDIVFFRHRLGERLAANVGLALVFGAFYFRFFGRP